MSIPSSIVRLFKPDPEAFRRLLEPDDRPGIDNARPRPTLADWRAAGAPGTDKGADIDGSYEPGMPGGSEFAASSDWHSFVMRGKP